MKLRRDKRWLSVKYVAMEYDKSFEVMLGCDRHVFDSFECAIHALAPKCAHCVCMIIRHGMEVGDGRFYCRAHCASQHGILQLEDRVREGTG